MSVIRSSYACNFEWIMYSQFTVKKKLNYGAEMQCTSPWPRFQFPHRSSSFSSALQQQWRGQNGSDNSQTGFKWASISDDAHWWVETLWSHRGGESAIGICGWVCDDCRAAANLTIVVNSNGSHDSSGWVRAIAVAVRDGGRSGIASIDAGTVGSNRYCCGSGIVVADRPAGSVCGTEILFGRVRHPGASSARGIGWISTTCAVLEIPGAIRPIVIDETECSVLWAQNNWICRVSVVDPSGTTAVETGGSTWACCTSFNHERLGSCKVECKDECKSDKDETGHLY